jgi:LmbE family N-acetylglucosaminyl deacetylase
MTFHRPGADFFVPDGKAEPLGRITHLGIGAHHDDLEFMAFHGILECFHHRDNQWFGGVTCTDGAGSSRTGPYASHTDEQMREVRREEQRTASIVGHYAAMIQLDYPSAVIKDPAETFLAEDLESIFRACRPRVVYTHNLADKHDTHLAVTAATVAALRRLEPELRPKSLLGCEGWRGLDWLGDHEKVKLNVSGHEHLAAALNGIFDSQIGGGKRYDLATLGRRAANATFLDSHASDSASHLSFAMDLTPLIQDDDLDPVTFTLDAVNRFRSDVENRLRTYFPTSA